MLSAIAGVFGVPLILRHVAEQQLGRWLGRTVMIERLRVNPFALSLTVDGLKVLETDGRTSFLGFRRLYVNAELASLFRHALVVRAIRLESPRVRLERRQAPDGTWNGAAVYNVSDIVARCRGPRTSPRARSCCRDSRSATFASPTARSCSTISRVVNTTRSRASRSRFRSCPRCPWTSTPSSRRA